MALYDAYTLGLGGAYLMTFLVILLIAYIYSAITTMMIANRLGHRDIAWMAWIPIVNIYLIVKMSGAPMWTMLLILVAWLPILNLVFLVAMIWWFWLISEKVGYPGWLSLINIIPFGSIVFLGLLAWGKPSRR